MKTLITTVALSFTVLLALTFGFSSFMNLSSSVKTQNEDLPQLWSLWKTKYSKAYATPLEDAQKFDVFTQNYIIITEWNAANKTSKLALNKFADMSLEEFTSLYLLNEVPQGNLEDCTPLPTDNLPAEWDWREHGAVTPVNDQGPYHTCWTFATAEVLESLHFNLTGKLIDFSEQQLYDCVCPTCLIGRPDKALEYTQTAGIMPYSLYPYNGERGTCEYKQSQAIMVNTGLGCVTPKDNNQLKAAVYNTPTATGVEADQSAWQFYSEGVLGPDAGCGDIIDHFPVTVGYGVYQGEDTWYVRNSWGEEWGVEGYAYVSRNQEANNGNGVCGITKQATYPTQTQ